jgi:hypothetical protein
MESQASLYDDWQTFEKKGPSLYDDRGKLFEKVVRPYRGTLLYTMILFILKIA